MINAWEKLECLIAVASVLKNKVCEIMPGYLGDKKIMVVHHLANKQNECDIYHIEKSEKQYFTPDLLENAITLGFSPCKWCN